MNILDELVPIPCTDRSSIDKLRSLLVEIQATWLDNLFDSGLTFSNPDVWEKMQSAVCLMTHKNNASRKGVDLTAIASDYGLLEQIFITKRWRYDEAGDRVLIDADTFKGCDLVLMHRFSPIAILNEVEAYRMERKNNG